MSNDDKIILTPDEAASLIADGDYVHNFIQSGMTFLGCDYERDDAIEAFRAAKSIEIGGPSCKAMKHPIAVFDARDRLSFFEADMEKVEAFESRARGEKKDTHNE